ncbi:MFS transporter [Bacteroides pyogenes]|uniref:MFS transporter n=1 Tax=Bacteroides pyogenes TaxID=310300 RepID=UPI001F3BA763|nr:MFS transporter [Bacteroides pyogenes]MCE9106965.1 MFS transporter [Bacteroides pyogenes]
MQQNENASCQKKINPIRWVPTVYFAMGLPLISLNLVSVVMFKDLGIDNKSIAFWTSWLLLPWSLKPIFSLVMETFGTKKKYVVFTELISAVLFGLIVFALPLPDFFSVTLALMGAIAISGSTHDIAGDGIYLSELDTTTQSRYSGWQGAFYNLAKVLANGGLVFLAGWLIRSMNLTITQSWQTIMFICAVILFLMGIYHWRVLPTDEPKKTGSFHDKIQELWEVFISFFRKKFIWIYLVFIFLYRFAEGLVMKIVPLFLKDAVEKGGIGLTNEQYGLVYGTFGTVAFIIGSISAGYYVSRFGLKKVLFSLVCMFNIPFAVYLLFAVFQPQQISVIALGIVGEYFGYGFGFVGLTLFMMQQIAPGKYQMAHYAFANSLMNLGVMLPGMISGYLSDLVGYKMFFIYVMVATIPAFLITYFIPFTYDDSGKRKKTLS